MAGAGPVSAKELAARADCAERYVHEWLNAQAAGGYVDYHAVSDISEGGTLVLGAQAGEARLAEVFRKAGFTHFRRAAETPFNLILEARR